MLSPDKNLESDAMTTRLLPPAALMLLGTAGCQSFDRAVGTNTSGAYPRNTRTY